MWFVNPKDSEACRNKLPGALRSACLKFTWIWAQCSWRHTEQILPSSSKQKKSDDYIYRHMQWRLGCDNAQCGVGRFHECCTMGWARTGSTEELCFKLFFELKRGKRLFLMLGFLPSQPSVWNIRRTKCQRLIAGRDRHVVFFCCWKQQMRWTYGPMA